MGVHASDERLVCLLVAALLHPVSDVLAVLFPSRDLLLNPHLLIVVRSTCDSQETNQPCQKYQDSHLNLDFIKINK